MGPASVARIIDTFRQSRKRKSLYNQIQEFQPKLYIEYETPEHIVKTAQTPGELLRALQLRHEVFVQEWQGRSRPLGIDMDEHDLSGDHLLIIDKSTWDVIGTYRLLLSDYTRNFYSGHEFFIHAFVNNALGRKLELGRACIRSDKRDGNSIDLLWKGLARYIEKSHARYLFGCASVTTTDPVVAASICMHLRKNDEWSDDYLIRPTMDYCLPEYKTVLAEEINAKEMRQYIPALLRGYLHAGAKVYGEPAYDREFSCFDLFTILDMTVINPRFKQRFFN